MSRYRKQIALGGVLAAHVALYAAGALPDLPDPKQTIENVAQALGPWTYLLVSAAAFLETGAFIGLVAPGETTVIVGGVIAGQGEIDLMPLIGLVWASCVLGDTASFFIGRRLGRGFLLRHGPKLRIDEQRLEHVESYFERHGGKTILIGRFIGLVRALAPFVAGTSGLPYRRFVPFSIIGCERGQRSSRSSATSSTAPSTRSPRLPARPRSRSASPLPSSPAASTPTAGCESRRSVAGSPRGRGARPVGRRCGR